MRIRTILMLLCLGSIALWAKNAQEYFRSAAFLYAQNKLPSAAIEAKEGLSKYPMDQKLQRLLRRIEEMQEKQKEQNQKENPNDSPSEDSEKSSSATSSAASSSSASPDSPNASSSSATPPQTQQDEPPLQEGQLDRNQAEQMLQDFQQNDQERKKATRARGRALPEKDW